MRLKNRFTALLIVALLASATLAAPALAVRSDGAEPRTVQLTSLSVWDWFAGLFVSQTDESRGQIVPDGGEGGDGGEAPAPPADPQSGAAEPAAE